MKQTRRNPSVLTSTNPPVSQQCAYPRSSRTTPMPPQTLRRILNVLIVILLLQTASWQKAVATVIPGGTFPEVSVITQPLHDVTINCDMLAVPGVSSSTTGFIKTIAWSTDSPSAQAYIYAEDFAGHSDILTLPAGSKDPDIALANYQSSVGFSLVYQAVVTYTIGTALYVEVYDLQYVGYSGFSINATPAYSVQLTDVCNGLPHVDMWADWNYPYVVNFCSNHQFAVVFSRDATNFELRGYINDVAGWSSSAADFPIPLSSGRGYVNNCRRPDVACQYEQSVSNTLSQVLQIAFEDCVYSSGSPVITTGMKTLEYDIIGTTNLGPALKRSGAIYAPRIEAVNFYNDIYASTLPKYQVAYDVGNVQVEGYNPIAGVVSISGPDFAYPYECMSACVAAGETSNSSLYPNIGNQQYTVGFYPWGSASPSIHPRMLSLFTRNIDFSGGALMSGNFYEVNSSPVDYYWDINRNMAISNCSNRGEDILTAWYNGTDIVYKHSTPDLMVFRLANNNAMPLMPRLSISPNPTTDILNLQGLAPGANYLVTDIAGRSVLQGNMGLSNSINAAVLPEGQYLLRIAEAGKSTQIFSFAKQ